MASSSKKIGNAAEIDRLALAFTKDPGSKVFVPLAEEYGKAGMWEEAVAVLEDGLKIYPGFVTAMVVLGRAYERMNQPIKAKAILEEAIKLSPDNLRAHRTLAKLYADQGDTEAAIRSCDVILSIHPRDEEALTLRAKLDGSTTHGAVQLQKKPVRNTDLASDGLQGEGTTSVLDKTSLVMKDEAHGSLPSASHSKERPVLTIGSIDHAAQKRKKFVIARLGQWLSLVQTRRRPPQVAS
jgi:tetratricopeptide (TPR) repeat protein